MKSPKECPMLPRLNPDPNNLVDVQQTAFSHEFLGRWVCSTWSEVSGNGGDPFDVVVIGAGVVGGYIADKPYRRGQGLRFAGPGVQGGEFSPTPPCPKPPPIGLVGPRPSV